MGDEVNLLEELKEFKAWVEERGLHVASTRLGRYIKAYQQLSTFTGWPEDLSDESREKFLFVMREAQELCWIYKGLKCAEPPGTLEILKKVLGGAELSRNDNPKAGARNFQFELRIASYFLQAGYEVDLSQQSDLVVQLPEYTLYVECKRLSSPKKVKQRAQEALTQLRHRFLENRRSSKCFGLAVFDVSKILYPGQGISIFPGSLVAREHILELLNDFNDTHSLELIFRQEKNILAVWLQVLTPVIQFTGPKVATRFSSLYLPLVPSTGGHRSLAFQHVRRALEVV